MASAIKTDFLSRAAFVSKDGFGLFSRLSDLALDYADLEYQPGGKQAISADDAVGTIEGLDPMDLLTAVQGIQAIGVLLDQNDGALRKAFKRLSQFAR